MAAVGDFFHRLNNIYLAVLSPPRVALNTSRAPLRLGILGAASIAPLAAIGPCRTHPDIIVSGIAARSRTKAEAYAKKHGIPRVFDSYEDLIHDAGIDVIYNPLPNGLHHRWSLEAIKAGKHVLLEKPSASNADQAREIFDEARKRNVLVLEAFHYRFHPAMHEFAYRLHDVMSAQNPMMAVDSSLQIPAGVTGEEDIRFNWKLAGGSLMDTGCYAVSSLLYTMRAAAGTWKRDKWEDGIEVREARPDYFVPSSKALREDKKIHLTDQGEFGVDANLEATLLVPTAREEKLPCKLRTGLQNSIFSFLGWKVPWFNTPTLTASFKDGTTVELQNYVMPFAWHRIIVTYRGGSAKEHNVKQGTQKTFKAYVPGPSSGTEQMERAAKDGHWPQGTGQEWWTTYRWQMEAFVLGVRAVQAGTPAHEVAVRDYITETRDDEGGKKPRVPVWVNNEESVTIMRCIDMIYERAGLGRRL